MVDALAIEIGNAETRVALVILRARFGVRNETPLFAAPAAILDVVTWNGVQSRSPPFASKIDGRRRPASCDGVVLFERGSPKNSHRPKSGE